MTIGTINVDNYITNYNDTVEPRNQSKQNNLLGDYIIDRGKLKHKLTFTLNLLTNTEWAELKAIMKNTFFPVKFIDDNLGEITLQFTCDSLPAPRKLRISDALSYYSDISLTLEEQ